MEVGFRSRGLAYAAGIDEEGPFPQFDWNTDGKFLELAAHGGRVDAAEERDMGVADQAMAGLQVFEAGEGGGSVTRYSQIGSRGVPWARVKIPVTRVRGKRPR